MIFTIDDVSQDVLDLIIKYEIYSNKWNKLKFRIDVFPYFFKASSYSKP